MFLPYLQIQVSWKKGDGSILTDRRIHTRFSWIGYKFSVFSCYQWFCFSFLSFALGQFQSLQWVECLQLFIRHNQLLRNFSRYCFGRRGRLDVWPIGSFSVVHGFGIQRPGMMLDQLKKQQRVTQDILDKVLVKNDMICSLQLCLFLHYCNHPSQIKQNIRTQLSQVTSLRRKALKSHTRFQQASYVSIIIGQAIIVQSFDFYFCMMKKRMTTNQTHHSNLRL